MDEQVFPSLTAVQVNLQRLWYCRLLRLKVVYVTGRAGLTG